MTAHRDQTLFRRPALMPGMELVSAAYHARAFPVHIHDEVVIGTLTAGSERLVVDGREHLVEPGDVLTLHAGQPHANHCVGQVILRYRVFYLDADSIAALMPGKRGPISFEGPVKRSPDLARALIEAHQILWESSGDPLEHESAGETIRDALSATEDAPPIDVRGAGRAVRAARDWIDEHYASGISLSDLAAVAGLSASRLAHLFSGAVGLSPIAYRNQRRVFEARRLLLTGMPIAETALHVGFADQSHLTRQFQRLLGASPGRYLQQ